MSQRYLKFIFSIFFLAAIASSFMLWPQFSQAAGAKQDLQNQLDAAGNVGWGATVDAANGLPIIIQYAISAFLSLLGIIFLILIIYAGYEWMTAQGDEEKVTKAKNTLTRAVIGLVIIIAAYAITYFVFQSLAGVGSGAGGTTGVNETPRKK